MQEAAVSPLTAWENFYVITGSAAAALTGLMFVVITLIASSRVRRSSGTLGAFGTPTVVHFCLALLVAAILSAPWQVLWNAGLLLGLAGLGGATYVVIVLRRGRQQTDYEKNINEFLKSKCDLIVTVGFLMGDATAVAAKANPTQDFQILGHVVDGQNARRGTQAYSPTSTVHGLWPEAAAD